MALEVIRGAFGSGKTTYILDSIEKNLKNRRNIIIVPEQFSYLFEKEVCRKFGGAGLNNVEVITLKRLVTRYLPKRQEKVLTPVGKMMIIYKTLSKLPEDSIFHDCLNKPGFMDKVSELLTEFMQYMVTPEILREKADKMENKLLREKVFAIAGILEEYQRVLNDGFYDSDEDIQKLADYSKETGCFSGCDFWFDDFSIFLPQHYKIMESFLASGSCVHVAVSIDEASGEIYEINEGILKNLKNIAKRAGVSYSEYKTDDVIKGEKSEELKFLQNNINNRDNPDFSPWQSETKDISIFISKDLYKEVRRSAMGIRRLVMEEGYRFRDISVVCGDIEGYSHIIEAVFNDFQIPYFSDSKLDTENHPVSTLLLSAFSILVENWSYPAVFRYLRTGLLTERDEDGAIKEIDGDAVDLLENYILKYGIRGKSIWLDDEAWESSQKGLFEEVLKKGKDIDFTDEDIEKINRVRKVIIEPFGKLYEKLSGRRTVLEFARGLFEFLGDINLYDCLKVKSEEFKNLGLNNEAEQFRMAWNVIIETLEQTVNIAGDEKVKREDFLGLIRAGLSASDISIIPSGLDRVAVSGIERSRQHQAKVMYIMGAVSGAIPKETMSGGLLGDRERELLNSELQDEGFGIAPESRVGNEVDRFNFYDTIFGVGDKIFISYPSEDSEGNVLRPSTILGEFYKVFPNMKEDDNIINTKEEEFLYSPRSAYQYMLWQKGRAGLSKDIYDWFLKNEPQKLKVLENADNYKKVEAKITGENAERLYDKTDYTITKLGEFGRCPFGYFVKYGLKAREREIWQLRKFDLGSVMHLAVEKYCQRVDNGAEDFESLRNNWLKLTDEESSDLVAQVMGEIGDKIVEGMNRDQNKIRYVIMRMTKIVARTVGLIKKSLTAGEYVAVAYEKRFRVEVKWQGKSTHLRGTIDRVDMAEVKDKKIAELRVIDYKTGKKRFSVVDICNKQDIQLVMYAIAAIEMYKSGEIPHQNPEYEPKMRAICYNNMRDDLVKCSGDEEEIERARAEATVPDGLVLLDLLDDENYDLSAAERMDADILKNKTSHVMKLGITSKGEISKRESKVMSTDGFSMLMDYVKKSVIEIDEEIFDGVIRICPKNGSQDPCQWCEFGEVCLYNERFDKKDEGVTDEDEAWEKIKKEVGEDGKELDD